ncbi:MAG: S8 family serine peptidase [Pseudomonadota bacterium]
MVRSIDWTRVVVVLAGVLIAGGSFAATPTRVDYWDLLSTDTVGARAFIEAHPTWDGRGVVIAVLDTGVDMSVPGLTTLPQGGVKVIEARDFTGQGRVKLQRPVEKDEGKEKVLTAGGGVVRGHGALTPAPAPETLLLGFLKEQAFRASSVEDINENGKTDDVFAVLAGEIDLEGRKEWRLWIDRDGDGHVDDEEPVRSYSEAHETFFLTAAPGNSLRPPMAFAATLDADRREVDLHFADGSHGTHVAGIAAGYRLYGKAGYHGIAPGARIMSLKIGDNTLSGGSTRSGSMASALRFAGNWSEKHDTPVVVNVSYGIGTETEGTTDIDRIVDGLLGEFSLLSVATSAGNSGPGLSSVGTPAGADFVFSTGAVLTRDIARTLYDTEISRDILFYFSSRGGELAKPDGVAPGAAASTVPPWEWGIVMRGTSMASPQAAGCLALLASAARTAEPRIRFNGGMLRTALRNSGRPLPGYTLLDQGSGVIDVTRGWRSLQRLAKEETAWKVLGYRVRGTAPYLEDEEGPAAFFRTGTWFPRSPERISFRVLPVFLKEMPDAFRDQFFQVFDLVVEGGLARGGQARGVHPT